MENSCQLVNMSNCTKTNIPLCASSLSGDIAVDGNENLYYINDGNVLLKQNHNETTCQSLGTFPSISPSNTITINSLVVDSNNDVYASGTNSNSPIKGRFYKYNPSTGIVEIGLLPNDAIPLGDLFFFENRLFLTCRNNAFTDTFLLEINVANPSISSTYMNLNGISPFGAFSTYANGVSKSYLLTRGFTQGKIYELNIPLQTITLLSCDLNTLLNGADSYYELSDPLRVNSVANPIKYFNVKNPARTSIDIDTNIDNDMVKSLALYDITGRRTTDFKLTDKLGLPIAGLNPGLYILQLVTIDGVLYNQKIVIKN